MLQRMPIRIRHGLTDAGAEPLVVFETDDFSGGLTPADAIELGAGLIAAAQASRNDAAVWAYLRRTGRPADEALQVLSGLYRQTGE